MDYKDSNEQYYEKIPTNFAERKNNWPLPYRSILVVPIMPLEDSEASKLIGFFCIDCEKTDAFNREYDPNIAIGIADGLYNVLKKHAKALNKR